MNVPDQIKTLSGRGPWQECFEGAFLQEYFECLQAILGEAYYRWTFHLLHHNLAISPAKLPSAGKGNVLLWFSDESSGPAEEAAAKFEHVFKCYALPNDHPRNVHPFPLCGASAVHLLEPQIFNQRRYQVFFSGNLNRQRADLFMRLRIPLLDNFPPLAAGTASNILLAWTAKCMQFIFPRGKSLPSSFIQFNNGFAKGLSREQYATLLADSKICLCPAGFITSETMRHYEAMRMGCVVLSCELPRSLYYSGSPVIQLKSWRGIRKRIDILLGDERRLGELSAQTQKWWVKHCSPQAVALYTIKVLVSQQ